MALNGKAGEPITHNGMILRYTVGLRKVVCYGDKYIRPKEEIAWVITGGKSPHKPASSGFVWLQDQEEFDAGRSDMFERYPQCIDAQWESIVMEY